MGNFCAPYTQPNSSNQRSEKVTFPCRALHVIHLSLRSGSLVCVLNIANDLDIGEPTF
jgi:hypothetical protein